MFKKFDALCARNHDINVFDGMVTWKTGVDIDEVGNKTYKEQYYALGNFANIEICDNGSFRGEFISSNGEKFILKEINTEEKIEFCFVSDDNYGEPTTVSFSRQYEGTQFNIHHDYHYDKCNLNIRAELDRENNLHNLNLNYERSGSEWEDDWANDVVSVYKNANGIYEAFYASMGDDGVSGNDGRILQEYRLFLAFLKHAGNKDITDLPFDRVRDCFDEHGHITSRNIYSEVSAKTATSSPLEDLFSKTVINYDNTGDIQSFEKHKFNKEKKCMMQELYDAKGKFQYTNAINIVDSNIINTYTKKDEYQPIENFVDAKDLLKAENTLQEKLMSNELYQQLYFLARGRNYFSNGIPSYGTLRMSEFDKLLKFQMSHSNKLLDGVQTVILEKDIAQKAMNLLKENEFFYKMSSSEESQNLDTRILYGLMTNQLSLKSQDTTKNIVHDVLDEEEHHNITTDSNDAHNYNLE